MDELLARLQEGFRICADAIGEYLQKIAPVDRRWNPEKIQWTKVDGPSGPYERSENANNLEFKAMLKDLASNSGKMRRDGWFYWVFENGFTVGRKWKGKTGSNPHKRMEENLNRLKKAGETLT